MAILNRIKDYINVFKTFTTILKLSEIAEFNKQHRSLIMSYNKDYEKELDKLVLKKLSELMLEKEISPDFILGYRAALTSRISFLGLRETKFPINNN